MVINALYCVLIYLFINKSTGENDNFMDFDNHPGPWNSSLNLHQSSDLDVTDKSTSDRKNYCPDLDLISPCYCTHDGDVMDLHCQYIGSEEALRHVFLNSSYFERKDFREFRMMKNKHVKVLEDGVFNDVTFTDFWIMNNYVLEEIEEGALDGSFDTARKFYLFGNNITTFPFESLKNFKNLEYFDFGYNSVPEIPVDTFRGLDLLKFINLGHTTSNIETGTFNNLPSLENFALYNNDLPNIPSGFLQTNSSALKIVSLWGNGVETVEPGALEPIEGLYIGMTRNSIQVIDETTWKPLLQAGVVLDLWANPITCDCSIAWLIRDQALLQQLTNSTNCDDFTYVHDLNPADYAEC